MFTFSTTLMALHIGIHYPSSEIFSGLDVDGDGENGLDQKSFCGEQKYSVDGDRFYEGWP
jgi:hypothetical protein